MKHIIISLGLVLGFGSLLILLPACAATSTQPPPPSEIIFRNWEGDISQDILDAFKAETGITVTYLPYNSQEEAIADIQAGQVYDVVVGHLARKLPFNQN